MEIGTDETSLPDADWIGHVLTYKAKRHLRSYLSAKPAIGYKHCKHCHPLPADVVAADRSASLARTGGELRYLR